VIVAGNWKMYEGPDPDELAARLADLSGVDAIVCPPYVSLARCVEAGLTTYAQNVHWENDGAYTGEISPAMLLGRSVAGSLVGHSERRQYFGETDAGVARRAKAALEAGLGVIACVGETQEERDSGDMETVLRIQVDAIRDACGAHERLVLAYEPVWAIGTGRTATPEMAQEAHAFVKSLLDRPVLYGGSVKPDNADELMSQPDVDGALVGGASLDVESFVSICQAAARAGGPVQSDTTEA
jgi:triosephosphate isomerase